MEPASELTIRSHACAFAVEYVDENKSSLFYLTIEKKPSELTNSSFMQINIVVFVLVIRQMMGTRHVQNKTQVEKVKAGVKASAVILPLLGITWLFGLLSFSSSTVAFKYLFAITNSLQGLMIFIFHCLLNKQVRGKMFRMQVQTESCHCCTC